MRPRDTPSILLCLPVSEVIDLRYAVWAAYQSLLNPQLVDSETTELLASVIGVLDEKLELFYGTSSV